MQSVGVSVKYIQKRGWCKAKFFHALKHCSNTPGYISTTYGIPCVGYVITQNYLRFFLTHSAFAVARYEILPILRWAGRHCPSCNWLPILKWVAKYAILHILCLQLLHFDHPTQSYMYSRDHALKILFELAEFPSSFRRWPRLLY